MSKSLRISDDLSLPLELVTQTIAVLAKRRVGKSYLCARVVEELFRAGEQVIVLDPKGDWWGLRSSADGKREGLPILILGGEHGDLPLEPGSGEAIARLVVEERISVLVDLSSLRKSEVATLSTGFLETLYRLKAKEEFRTPVLLVIDEADAIAPQKPMHGEERMLGAAEDIVRRGGQRGIGCMMATQRTAVLNKNVLTQAQVMIALRTIAPQDLAAMNAWIDVHGSPEERKTLMGSLPSLPVGTAWVWSPGWPTERGIFQRVEVSARTTFDSGATPRPGEKRAAPKTLAEVDLAAVKKSMADVVERAKADDPKLLRKRIAELERDVARKAPPSVEVSVPVFDEIAYGKLESAVLTLKSAHQELTRSLGNAHDAVHVYRSVVAKAQKRARASVAVATNAAPPARRAPSESSSPSSLGKGERAILTAAAQRGEGGVTREQLSVLTGYKKRSRDTYLQRLKAAGLTDQCGDRIVATSTGVAELGTDFEPLPTGKELRLHWLRKLPEGERRVFEVLVNAYPDVVARTLIDDNTGYAKRSRDTYLQRLSARRLVETKSRGEVIAAKELFE
jgi:hypothetical protein